MISSKKKYMEKFASEVNETLKNSRKWKRHYVTDLKISDRAKMVIADMDLQPANDLSPILVTPSGIAIVLRDVQ